MSDTTEEATLDSTDVDTEGLGAAVVASVASVALALYFYYVRDDKQRGQFVGLWPVTILGLASYFQLKQIKQLLAESGE